MAEGIDGEDNEGQLEDVDQQSVTTDMIVETEDLDLMILNDRTHRRHFERQRHGTEQIDIGIVERELDDHGTCQLIEPVLRTKALENTCGSLVRATESDDITTALVGFVDRSQRSTLRSDTALERRTKLPIDSDRRHSPDSTTVFCNVSSRWCFARLRRSLLFYSALLPTLPSNLWCRLRSNCNRLDNV